MCIIDSLDTFIKLAYQELGVVTRISTVGYSRHNSKLNEVHRKINTLEYLHYLGGVRISFTPYAIAVSYTHLDVYKRQY